MISFKKAKKDEKKHRHNISVFYYVDVILD